MDDGKENVRNGGNISVTLFHPVIYCIVKHDYVPLAMLEYRDYICFCMHLHWPGPEEAIWTRERVIAILACWYDSIEKCHKNALKTFGKP